MSFARFCLESYSKLTTHFIRRLRSKPSYIIKYFRGNLQGNIAWPKNLGKIRYGLKFIRFLTVLICILVRQAVFSLIWDQICEPWILALRSSWKLVAERKYANFRGISNIIILIFSRVSRHLLIILSHIWFRISKDSEWVSITSLATFNPISNVPVSKLVYLKRYFWNSYISTYKVSFFL